MNIIWLTPEIPYPPIGGRNGVFNRIVQLSKYNKIFLFSVAYSDEEVELKQEMEKYCEEVHYYNRNDSKIGNIFKSLTMPYSVASRTMPAIQQEIRKVLNSVKIDVIVIDFPNMARNLSKLNYDCYITLNQHNNEYRRMRDMYYIETIPIYKRIAYLLESYRLESYERHLYCKQQLDSITFFSRDDYNDFSKKWRKCSAELEVFPLGANQVSGDVACKDYNHNTFLFVGRLDKIAITNVEAVLWFCRKVLPLIRKRSDVQIIIAGANPCKEIYDLQDEVVRVVPNYQRLEDVYEMATYVILPLLSGGGVKGKLLEAAAFERTIISTKHGIEGTEFVPGKHVLLGETAEEFAEQCINAINNYHQSVCLAQQANILFKERYEWSQIGIQYNEFLKKEVSKKKNED